MIPQLIRKELHHYLLDFRFISILVVCTALAGLSLYVGIGRSSRELSEYRAVSGENRRFLEESLAKGVLRDVDEQGVMWNRRPEILSPIVYGLSGVLGKEVLVKYQSFLLFVDSDYAVDPIHALFGTLDFAFIVQVVMSLCALLLTYDAICGEKESGTLRVYASFSVPRSHIALAKLIGASIASLIPFAVPYLLAAAVLALSPGMGLKPDDWARLGVLTGVFSLYITVFAAFGLLVSALSQRRMTAFLVVLGLWTIWLFAVPNLAVLLAQGMAPVESIYRTEEKANAFRWDIREAREAESRQYWSEIQGKVWERPEARQQVIRDGNKRIQDRWDAEFHLRQKNLLESRRNMLRQQQSVLAVASSISPAGSAAFAAMDLARTGTVQHQQIEDALHTYSVYLASFIQKKREQPREGRDLTDFVWFSYENRESVNTCAERILVYILHLAVLAVLGFAGAFVGLLRYDVR